MTKDMHETFGASPAPLPGFYRSIALPLLASIVLLPYAAILVLSLFTGAYVDDILSPLSSARAGYDGWRLITIYPQCGTGNVIAIPLSFLPGRVWSWLIHAITYDFYSMRLISIVLLLGWIGYTTWFVKECLLPKLPIYTIILGIICLTGMGAQTLALLLNRPETGMIFAITFFLSLPFWVTKYPSPSRATVYAVGTIFFLVMSWFLSAHPKAMLYIPLLLVSALYLCKWPGLTGIILTGLVVIGVYQGWWDYWHLKLNCAESPLAQHEWDSAAVRLSLWFTDRPEFWKQIKNNFSSSSEYVTKILFHPKNTWLPLRSELPHEVMMNNGITVVIMLLFIWMLRLLGTAVEVALVKRAVSYPAFLLTPCLVAAALAQCGLQTDKNFYTSGLIWITFLLAALVIASYLDAFTSYWQERKKHLITVSILLCVFCGLNEYFFLSGYIPATRIAVRTANSIGVMGNGRDSHDMALSPWGLINPVQYSAWKKHITAIAQACHIPTDRSGRHVVIDMLTYLPFKETYQPFYLLFELHEFDKPSAFFAFLRRRESSGLVMLCRNVPAQVRPYAKEYDGVCCLGKEQVETARISE